MPRIQSREDICFWHLRGRIERIIAGVVLLLPCIGMAGYGLLKMEDSSNYILLQLVGWAGIFTYILQFLQVEGIEFTEKQIYFFRGPLVLGLFWHSERVSMERAKEIYFQHKSKQEFGQKQYTIEAKGKQGQHKAHWYFSIKLTNRDAARKMIQIVKDKF